MNDKQRKRIDEKVGYWDQLKTSLTPGADQTQKDNMLNDIATQNEEEERKKKEMEEAARRSGGQS